MEQDEVSAASQNEPVANNNDSDDNEEYSVEEDTWIEWFCKMEGNHFLVEISQEFLLNKANLLGLEKEFPNYQDYLDIILSREAPSAEILNEEYMEKMGKIKELYGILHKRFLYTPMGKLII
jgi:casein kinase II subunit beta